MGGLGAIGYGRSSIQIVAKISRRDYRSVELASDAENRIPLGMRPIGGRIPTACNEWGTGIFYRARHP